MGTAPLVLRVCKIFLDCSSKKGPRFSIWSSILMPLSPHHPKTSCFTNIVKQIHYIVPFVRNVSFKKCQVFFFDPHCIRSVPHIPTHDTTPSPGQACKLWRVYFKVLVFFTPEDPLDSHLRGRAQWIPSFKCTTVSKLRANNYRNFKKNMKKRKLTSKVFCHKCAPNRFIWRINFKIFFRSEGPHPPQTPPCTFSLFSSVLIEGAHPL